METTGEKFFYFWSGPFSQWSKSPFSINGEKYNCAEQYMMAEKARMFKDWSIEQKIMASMKPNEQKSLGRMVKPYDDNIWKNNAKRIVYTGNYFKFTQNKMHFDALLDTDGFTLVEASPFDTLWGIGLSEDDPNAWSRDTWKGQNWLGDILTLLREDLKNNLATYRY